MTLKQPTKRHVPPAELRLQPRTSPYDHAARRLARTLLRLLTSRYAFAR